MTFKVNKKIQLKKEARNLYWELDNLVVLLLNLSRGKGQME
jgi:hypothetical protein